MPDLTLTFQDPEILDDCAFHPCVRFNRYQVDKQVTPALLPALLPALFAASPPIGSEWQAGRQAGRQWLVGAIPIHRMLMLEALWMAAAWDPYQVQRLLVAPAAIVSYSAR